MQIDDNQKQRLGASMEALNARIARLAMALDVSLQDEATVNALMDRSQIVAVPQERRTQTGHQPSLHRTDSPERRMSHQREELRGLLILRYHLEAHSLSDYGLESTRKILLQAEENLLRQGFKPGADGLGLDDLFKAV